MKFILCRDFDFHCISNKSLEIVFNIYLKKDKKIKGLLLSSIGGGIFGMVKIYHYLSSHYINKVMQNFSLPIGKK